MRTVVFHETCNCFDISICLVTVAQHALCDYATFFPETPKNALNRALYTYRDLYAKKHRDKNSLFALEKPAVWSYDSFISENRRIGVLIGYMITFTGEQNRAARLLAAPLD